MEKNKIKIFGLIIVIVALFAATSIAFASNDFLNLGGSPQTSDMEKYDFDGAFTMNVPKDNNFSESLLEGDDKVVSDGVSRGYFSKDNQFSVLYVNSDELNDELVGEILSLNDTNVTSQEDGDFLIVHYNNASGKVGNSWDTSEFKESVAIYNDTDLIVIDGNDLDFIKAMADTVELK